MNKQSRSTIGFVARSAAGWLLLCALLMRGMIPGGYMPNFAADPTQGFLIICSGNGATVQAGQDDTPVPADTHQDGLCAFAMLGSLAPLLVFVALLLLVPPRAARRLMPPVIRHLRQIACAPPGARAPPVFA